MRPSPLPGDLFVESYAAPVTAGEFEMLPHGWPHVCFPALGILLQRSVAIL